MNPKILGVRGFQKHGIKDDTWTIKDKVHQYKGILKLYGRDKKLKAIAAAKLQQRVSKELNIVKSEVKEYRRILNDVQCGDKRRLRNLLRDHHDLLLAYENHDPSAVYDAIYQDYNLKRRQLDTLYYVKSNKMKEFFDLKLESTTILNELDDQSRLHEPNRHQQNVAALYEKLVANKRAAETIHTTYQTMLNILEKDTIYFTAILNALKGDRIEQCKVLMETTYVGQLAAEDLDDTRQRYKNMSFDVLKNMKVRERTLKTVRTRVDNLWSDIKLLVRVESDTKYMAGMQKQNKTSVEEDLEKQIKSLEGTFERVKDTLLARSYDELSSRFEEQARQRTRLMGQFETSLNERDAFLNKNNSAELILADLKHSIITTTGQYKSDKKELLENIEEEKRREADFIKLRKSRGELLINIKTSLQNMLAIMICVRGDWNADKKSEKDGNVTREKRKQMEMKDDKSYRSYLEGNSNASDSLQLEKVDLDAWTMLEEVVEKATILFRFSNFEIAPENEEKARNLYQNYVAEHQTNQHRNRLKSNARVFLDNETTDSTVFTRADIKANSKNIVEAHTRFD